MSTHYNIKGDCETLKAKMTFEEGRKGLGKALAEKINQVKKQEEKD